MRNVIVTGGSRGLGLEIASRLAACGYGVAAVARSESPALSAAIQKARDEKRGTLQFRAADLSDIAAIPQLVKNLRKDCGPIYGLVNNAGLGTPGVLANMREEQMEALLRLNVMAPMTLTKYVLRSMMVEQKGGRIINISSVVSLTGYSGLSVYSATKSALMGFTRSLAREVGQLGITVNAIAPGFAETEMTSGMTEEDRGRIAQRSALRRLIDATDVAHAVEFLLSDGAKNITGTLLTVDAGNTA
ncbi:MAG TPA: SDR family NAD(P)-dependent oxidoreductase [Burkholderiaceae bacterium]|nr:SDR family NAD(P)-dependent oxidoreductase [Burkholderiaceae bacterium]